MHKRSVRIGYKMFFGLLALTAVVTEIAVLIERSRFKPVSFFSFFTIESNILAGAVLILSSLALAGGKQSKVLAMFRGAATLYMAITGIVFALLLSGIEGAEFTTVPWDNIVLHYIMPIVLTADWFLDVPKIRIAFKYALIWLIFPIAYVVYSLGRGYIVGWYPYPFLDPGERGYGEVAVTTVGVALLSAGLIWLLTRATLRSPIKKSRR